ncbi:MAG: hypothetical protein JF924_00995 [Candidatus Dormibacteraeota bacterium]|nr:hypothetical protein [Candidatus Dormibacteraeota bacterium]
MSILDAQRAQADFEAGRFATDDQVARAWAAVTDMENSAVRQAAIDLQRANVSTLELLQRFGVKPRGRSTSQPSRRRGGTQYS